jgi:hypothetical protein
LSAACLALAMLAPAGVLSARQTSDNSTTYYGAIAYSQSTGRWGYSSGFSAEVNARRQSLRNCVAGDCKVVLIVGNGYAALALGDDTSAYGFGHSKTDQGVAVARRFALQGCQQRTRNCRIVVSVHSWAG